MPICTILDAVQLTTVKKDSSTMHMILIYTTLDSSQQELIIKTYACIWVPYDITYSISTNIICNQVN